MTALFIILPTVALLFYTKIYLCAVYGENGFSLYSSILGKRIVILPKNKKERKEKKSLQTEDKLEALRIILKTLGKIKHIIVFDLIKIRYTVSDENPYNAVRKYNAVNAIVVFLNSTVSVKDKQIFVDMDMRSEKSVIEAEFKLSVRVFQILYLGLFSGTEVIKLISSRKAVGREERKAIYGK